MAKDSVEKCAGRQLGLITRKQARALGVSNGKISRNVDSGAWVQVHAGVYRFSAAPATWHQRLLAGCFAAGPGAIVSHESAALLWQLDGVYAASRTVVDILVRYPRQPDSQPGLMIHRSRELPGKDCTIRSGIPVTSLPRTVIDLSPRLDDKMLERAIEDVIRRRRHNFTYLWDRMKKLIVGRPGAARVRALLIAHEEAAIGDYNAFETYVRQNLTAHGIPIHEQNFDVWDGEKFVASADFAWPGAKVAIMADGYFVHGRKERFFRDRDQWNDFAEADWDVVHVHWEHIQRNDPAIVRQTRKLLARRAPQIFSGG